MRWRNDLKGGACRGGANKKKQAHPAQIYLLSHNSYNYVYVLAKYSIYGDFCYAFDIILRLKRMHFTHSWALLLLKVTSVKRQKLIVAPKVTSVNR